jgi:hypothetical protein
MASSGDPSTFTFTMDAFPDYTRFGDKKVLSVIQIIEDASNDEYHRVKTDADDTYDKGDKIGFITDTAVKNVIELIDKIKLDDTASITAAETAYTGLNSTQIAQVYNVEKLMAAKKHLTENAT